MALPVPSVADVMVMNDELLVAVHSHAAPVVMFSEPEPPVLGADALAGVSVYEQGAYTTSGASE